MGTRLLQHALNEGSADSFIVDAYLHVQTNNDDAIAFYKRFGFVTDQVVQNYYKRLDPSDAVILKLDLKEWKVRVMSAVLSFFFGPLNRMSSRSPELPSPLSPLRLFFEAM